MVPPLRRSAAPIEPQAVPRQHAAAARGHRRVDRWRWPGCWRSGSGSSTLAPDFLTDFVLYALSATNLTILVALVFVLARNIVKLVVERRRALPFARFRAKLVTVLLGMTLMPAVLVLIVGSELIRNSVDRWFNAPMDEMLSSANAHRRRLLRAAAASRVGAGPAVCARARIALTCAASPSAVRDLVAPDVLQERIDLVEVYRVSDRADGRSQVTPVVDVAAPSLPREYSRASADRLAERAAASGSAKRELSNSSSDWRRSDSHGGADPLVAERARCVASSSRAST